MRIYRTVTIIILLFFGLVSCAQNTPRPENTLRLEKVVMVSRHGLRAPLQKYYDSLSILNVSSI